MTMKTEIWKLLPGVTGVEVSTLGNIRTLDRIVSSENGTRFLKGRVLKQCNDKDGYLLVHIPIDGKFAMKRVHRLVAQAFIPNHDGLPEINHKDNNPLNNNVSNLEWVTHEENIAYREKYGTPAKDFVKKLPVFAINLSTLEVLRFRSQGEAGRKLGVFKQSINAVLKGRLNKTHGYWFVNDDGHAVDVVKSKLHDIGGTGLKIKHQASIKKIFS